MLQVSLTLFDPAISAAKCNQPTITNGSVTPATATVEQGDTYEASCDSGFTLSGWATMTCQSNGTFGQIPTCEGTHTYYSIIVGTQKSSKNYGQKLNLRGLMRFEQ